MKQICFLVLNHKDNSCLKENFTSIIDNVRVILEHTPPELAADIVTKGVMLTGGGALIRGFDKLIHKELKIPVKYIGVGEQIEDLQKFDAEAFAKALLGLEK